MSDKPSIASTIGPRIAAIPRSEQRFVVAYAERVAARRYRAWAVAAPDAETAEALRACAVREEEIAGRVEALSPRATEIQQTYLAAHPDLEEAYLSLFDGEPLTSQFAIQAEGERLGAATWRIFAAEQQDPAHRDVFLACAALEEASAQTLEALTPN